MRAYPPFRDGTTTQFAAVNHAKRYVTLDLRSEAGQAALRDLVADADVLIQNARPGHEGKLGLDADSCHVVNPRLIHATVAAFHPADGDRPGYDMLVQGESGLLDQTGEPDRPPSRIGASAIDHATGLWLALAVLAALHGSRERETVRVSMLDVAVGLLNEKVSAYIATGEAPQRMGAGTSVTTPHGAFATADGYIVIGAATDAAFAQLAHVLGPPLDSDERFRHPIGTPGPSPGGRGGGDRSPVGPSDRSLARRPGRGGNRRRPRGQPGRGRGPPPHARAGPGCAPVEGSETIEVLAPAVSFGDERWPALPLPGAPDATTTTSWRCCDDRRPAGGSARRRFQPVPPRPVRHPRAL